MSAATVTDLVPAARPAVGRPARSRGAGAVRLRPVSGPAVATDPAGGATAATAATAATTAAAVPAAGAGLPADDSVTVTVRVGPGGAPDGVLAALRDLIAAAGTGSGAVDIQGAPAGAAPDAVGHPADGAAPDAVAAAGDAVVQVHPATRAVTRAGRLVPLSRLEYDLLLFLARNPRRVFSRSQLLRQVWGHTHTSARSVDVHVSRLRTKLGEPDAVTTVYGVGYRLADDSAVALVR